MTQEEGFTFFTTMVLLLGGLVIIIIKEKKEDERIYKHPYIGISKERKEDSGSSKTTQNKTQNIRNFVYVDKKKKQFKLRKDAGKN